MAKKLGEEELNNVSGGCGGYRATCNICNGYDDYEFWGATYTDPTTKKSKKIKACKSCAEKNKDNPNYKDWYWMGHAQKDFK